MKAVITFFMIFLAMFGILSAQTNLSSNFTVNTTLTAANSPYIVTTSLNSIIVTLSGFTEPLLLPEQNSQRRMSLLLKESGMAFTFHPREAVMLEWLPSIIALLNMQITCIAKKVSLP
jgi:hypothetical protein